MRKEHPIRKYRRLNEKTAKEVSKTLGIAEVTVRSFENGHRTVQAEFALKIEKLLGIHRAELRPDLWQKAA